MNSIERMDFRKLYADFVPMTEVAVVVDKVPYSWRIVLLEVYHNTELGEKMLRQLLKRRRG